MVMEAPGIDPGTSRMLSERSNLSYAADVMIVI